AVVGSTFWPAAIATLEDAPSETVSDALNDLARRDLVREVPTTFENELEFAFTHAVIRDVAYERIPRLRRASKHAAAGRWIEQRAGDRSSERAELLAHHYGAAVALTRAASEEPDPGLEEAARTHLLLAADRA